MNGQNKGWFDYQIDSFLNIMAHIMLDIREIAWDFYLLTFTKGLSLAGWFNEFVVSRLPEFDAASHWALLPGHIIQLLNYLHFGQCLTIVIGALLTRFSIKMVGRIREFMAGNFVS